MHFPKPVDNFGSEIRWRDYLPPIVLGATKEETAASVAECQAASERLMNQWEVATSTYGGDSFFDNNDV